MAYVFRVFAHTLPTARRAGQRAPLAVLRVESRSAFSTAAAAPGSGAAKSTDPVIVEPLNESGSIAAVKLNSPPANALSYQVLANLNRALQTCASDSSVKAVVITSASSTGPFSAGLDIREMAGANKESFTRFWSELQATFRLMYAHPKPIVAAINGPAPAGGCWLACMSDYRVIVDSPSAVMGLNETQLGIVAPEWIARPLVAAVGQRRGELMLQLGTMLPPKELLVAGAVDEIQPADQLLPAATAAAARFAAIPSAARHASKMLLRRELAGILESEASRTRDLESTWAFLSSPKVQQGLQAYYAKLTAPRKK